MIERRVRWNPNVNFSRTQRAYERLRADIRQLPTSALLGNFWNDFIPNVMGNLRGNWKESKYTTAMKLVGGLIAAGVRYGPNIAAIEPQTMAKIAERRSEKQYPTIKVAKDLALYALSRASLPVAANIVEEDIVEMRTTVPDSQIYTACVTDALAKSGAWGLGFLATGDVLTSMLFAFSATSLASGLGLTALAIRTHNKFFPQSPRVRLRRVK